MLDHAIQSQDLAKLVENTKVLEAAVVSNHDSCYIVTPCYAQHRRGIHHIKPLNCPSIVALNGELTFILSEGKILFERKLIYKPDNPLIINLSGC